jgi:hypothetical protein
MSSERKTCFKMKKCACCLLIYKSIHSFNILLWNPANIRHNSKIWKNTSEKTQTFFSSSFHHKVFCEFLKHSLKNNTNNISLCANGCMYIPECISICFTYQVFTIRCVTSLYSLCYLSTSCLVEMLYFLWVTNQVIPYLTTRLRCLQYPWTHTMVLWGLFVTCLGHSLIPHHLSKPEIHWSPTHAPCSLHWTCLSQWLGHAGSYTKKYISSILLNI